MRATKALKVDEKRLLAYAVAAGAVLAAAGPADASIVYSGLLNKTVTVNDPGIKSKSINKNYALFYSTIIATSKRTQFSKIVQLFCSKMAYLKESNHQGQFPTTN